MAAIRMTTNIFLNGVSQSAFRAFSTKRVSLAFLRSSPYTGCRNINFESFRCAAASQYGDARKKASARLSQVQQLLVEAEERASSAVNEPPPPKISFEHVTLNFARSGGSGGQNVNKINTKVNMRFNVQKATWLGERVREKIIQLACSSSGDYLSTYKPLEHSLIKDDPHHPHFLSPPPQQQTQIPNMPRHRFSIFTPQALRFFSTHRTHLQNVGPLSSRLNSRSVIRFTGPDSVRFLQGLLTNDVRQFGEPVHDKVSNLASSNMPTVGTLPVYAAMLTPQGRFLYDFFLYRPPRPDEKLNQTGSGPGPSPDEMELFADVDGSMVDELVETLKRYRLRSKVDIEHMGDKFCCWQRYGGNLSEKSSSVEKPEVAGVGYGGSIDSSSMSSSQGSESGWQWFKDPRLDCLGFRGIFPSGSQPPLVEADKEAAEENYQLWRLEKGVAEGPNEIPKGEAIPLEYNLAGLNAISFDKGCYVGQELVARTHHRGVIRKRVLPLKFIDDNGKEIEQKVAPGSVVVDGSSGKKVGAVTTALGSRGLGLLRLEEAFKGSHALAIQENEDVKVVAVRPNWWPAEWFLDDQERADTT